MIKKCKLNRDVVINILKSRNVYECVFRPSNLVKSPNPVKHFTSEPKLLLFTEKFPPESATLSAMWSTKLSQPPASSYCSLQSSLLSLAILTLLSFTYLSLKSFHSPNSPSSETPSLIVQSSQVLLTFSSRFF